MLSWFIFCCSLTCYSGKNKENDFSFKSQWQILWTLFELIGNFSSVLILYNSFILIFYPLLSPAIKYIKKKYIPFCCFLYFFIFYHRRLVLIYFMIDFSSSYYLFFFLLRKFISLEKSFSPKNNNFVKMLLLLHYERILFLKINK